MVPVSVLFSKINSKIKIRPIKTSFFKKVFAKIECPSLVQFFKKLITRYCDFKMWSINMNGDKSFFLHRGNKHLLGSWVEVRCFSWKTNKENFSNQYTIKKLLEKSNLFKFFFCKTRANVHSQFKTQILNTLKNWQFKELSKKVIRSLHLCLLCFLFTNFS
jgi:hypothetical protein